MSTEGNKFTPRSARQVAAPRAGSKAKNAMVNFIMNV